MGITAKQLRERLAGTRKPSNPLDVVMPRGTYSWPEGMLEKIASTLKPAGVLIPVRRHDTGLAVLLTQRSADLKHHAGQVSFPGGRMEEHDEDIEVTALRETREEIGITEDDVAIIGYLETMPTVTGYAVTPVVGLVDGAVDLRLDRTEVEYVFEVPLSFLTDSSNHTLVAREWQGLSFSMVEFHYEGQRIWGATAQMLLRFINMITK
ncbi:MAG: CoA pyrophosphatase [Woeseiaceae bacterium]|nr:CoA pyrophosphatase [Woeseiaceae bacterium]NIP19860.1 CoA pyrophosphatase [Woeseiaceae bacterium]NIS88661.1 CoA pyrophosphatase [Woeseiaceae bacterium]